MVSGRVHSDSAKLTEAPREVSAAPSLPRSVALGRQSPQQIAVRLALEVLEEQPFAHMDREPLEVPEAEEGLDWQAREDRVPLAKVEDWPLQRHWFQRPWQSHRPTRVLTGTSVELPG